MNQRRRFSLEFPSSQKLKKALFQFGAKSKDVALQMYLDSNGHSDPYSVFDAALALDSISTFSIDTACPGDWEKLETWQSSQMDWCFGHIAYDFKNAQEQLNSNNTDGIDFPEASFFVPKRLFLVQGTTLVGLVLEDNRTQWTEDCSEIQKIYDHLDTAQAQTNEDKDSGIELNGRWTMTEYCQKFDMVQKHIQRGDIYETNFCQEFYRDHTSIDPAQLFEKINDYSKAPFAAYYKLYDRYALCASPERYLTKRGRALVSQPIKGTLKRLDDAKDDRAAVAEFVQNPKERRENIMITDLVRNDLSQSAARDSVTVTELCALQSYAHVHQLVTTVSATLKAGLSGVNALKTTFPMGSMTGVPKIRALELMEHYEDHKRGLYSGAIGYFTPEGDFDFNVVIRSLLYNATNQYISLSVGGALTSSANAQDEYNECLLKAESLRTVLSRG